MGVDVAVAMGVGVEVGVGEAAETLTTPIIPKVQWTQQK
jgi:hypothetical protein